jgi:hypothetical protein
MNRRALPQVQVGLLTVLALTAAVLSVASSHVHSASTSKRPPLKFVGAPSYGFGGYIIQSPVTEVGAQWYVPAIAKNSTTGVASTWIGAQLGVKDFIQLGTTENKLFGQPQYSVFWSDVTVGFHPQNLISLSAGDLVKFKMVQVRSGWRLSYDDVTTNRTRSIIISYGAGVKFDTPSWFQEDPVAPDFHDHEPYPLVGVPTFSDLTVDNRAPRLAASERQILSTDSGVFLIPSADRNDSFTYSRPTGYARQYLVDVFPLNAALDPLQQALYSGLGPAKNVETAALRAIDRFDTLLSTQSWPPGAATQVKKLAAFNANLANGVRSMPRAPALVTSAQTASIFKIIDQSHILGVAVRTRVGLG